LPTAAAIVAGPVEPGKNKVVEAARLTLLRLPARNVVELRPASVGAFAA